MREVVQVCIPAGFPVPAGIVRGARCRRQTADFSGEVVSKCEHSQSFLLSIYLCLLFLFLYLQYQRSGTYSDHGQS